eukprot:6187917-Pleurochrysis_carterae.AAC.2
MEYTTTSNCYTYEIDLARATALCWDRMLLTCVRGVAWRGAARSSAGGRARTRLPRSASESLLEVNLLGADRRLLRIISAE